MRNGKYKYAVLRVFIRVSTGFFSRNFRLKIWKLLKGKQPGSGFRHEAC